MNKYYSYYISSCIKVLFLEHCPQTILNIFSCTRLQIKFYINVIQQLKYMVITNNVSDYKSLLVRY
jgi:hypothetical protein